MEESQDGRVLRQPKQSVRPLRQAGSRAPDGVSPPRAARRAGRGQGPALGATRSPAARRTHACMRLRHASPAGLGAANTAATPAAEN